MPAETSTESAALNDDELIARYIEPNPNRPGAYNVRVVDYCVPVWALIGHLEAVENSIERVAKDYDLPIDVVRAAVAYYRRHKEIIDARIAANTA